jgi:pimeloyl-ACP methyl ester carboxylesterase
MNAILFRALLLLLCAGPALAGETAVQLDTGKGVLHGTLLTPDGAARMPAVLIVPGSGPTDRNGNFPQMGGINNSLKLLAEGLARHGIASLRFDKRGIAASAPAAPSEAEMRIEQGADDAAGWIRRLRADPRFDRVALIGHSEGALVGMLAAQRAPVDAYVSLAGIGRPFDVVLREQLRPQLPAPLFEESERVRHHPARQMGHPARVRQDRCRRRVRHAVRPGRGRLQPRRAQLHQRDGAPGRSRGREGSLARPAHEAVHPPADMKAKYAASPAWLKKLMNAFADGLNFYLHTHPEVKPKLITHFEPWMALASAKAASAATSSRST